MDDYLIPRGRKFPIGSRADLAALRHLRSRRTPRDVARFAKTPRGEALAAELNW